MTKSEKIEAELAALLNSAPDPRRIEILESIEYKLAMKVGDVAGAYDFAYAKIIGSGKTKSERLRSAKRIKLQDAVRDLLR